MRCKFLKGVIWVGFVLAVLYMVNEPAHAGSQSVTFNVSCVVPTSIELSPVPNSESSSQSDAESLGVESSAFGPAPVSVKTNLGNNYNLLEENRSSAEGNSKLFSVTAL